MSKQFRKGKINGKEIVDTDKVLHMVLYHRGTKMDAKKKKKKNLYQGICCYWVCSRWITHLGPFALILKSSHDIISRDYAGQVTPIRTCHRAIW